MEEIKNYYQINDNLATSGQPTKEQFNKIAESGYEVVINLALPSSDNAIADEGAIVTSNGMAYFHIPVSWQAPKIDDVKLFFSLMQSLENRKIWVHCAMNMRVSCFIYLWQKCVLKLPKNQASYPMSELWQPSGVWAELIEKVEANSLT